MYTIIGFYQILNMTTKLKIRLNKNEIILKKGNLCSFFDH